MFILTFQCVWVQSENSQHLKWNKKATLKVWVRKSWGVDQPFWMDSIKRWYTAHQAGHVILNKFVDWHLSWASARLVHGAVERGKKTFYKRIHTSSSLPPSFSPSFLPSSPFHSFAWIGYLLYKQMCGWATDLENWQSGNKTINEDMLESRGGVPERLVNSNFKKH